MPRRLIVAASLFAAGGAALLPAQETPPPVPGVLAREPQTPAETFDAAVTMLQLARPELARQYLQNFLATMPDDATMLALREKHGSTVFVQLSRNNALQPFGGQALDLLNKAAVTQLNNPEFQQSLLKDLNGTPRQRSAAVSTLRALEGHGVALLVKRIGEGVSADEEERLIVSLLDLGDRVVPAMEAALLSPNGRVQLAALEILGRKKSESSLLKILALAYDPATDKATQDAAKRTAATLLYDSPDKANQITGFRLVDQLVGQALPLFRHSTEEESTAIVWSWDDAADTVAEHTVRTSSAALYLGELWARRALAINPDHPQAQTLLLGFLMQRDVEQAGWDQPIPEGPGTAHDLALATGPQLTSDTLSLGLDNNNSAAVVVSLHALSQSGSRTKLLTAGSPVLKALDSSDPRVQFAAANTIMQLDPATHFPGAGQVVQILARTLDADPQPASVVIDPNQERGATFAGVLTSLGYAPRLAPTGQRGFDVASSHGNIELAIVHLNTVRWELTQTIANLRTDPRTAGVPILVYGPVGLREATQYKLQRYQRVGYVHELADPEALRTALAPVLQERFSPPPTQEQRAAEMATAAYWLRSIAEGHRQNVFPLATAEASLSNAINRSEVAVDALVALGGIDTASAQQRLAEVGLSPGHEVKVREAAITQLAFHVQRFGRLVSNEQVKQINETWTSEQEPVLKSAWAAVLGALGVEPSAATRLLLDSPPPAAPLR